MGATAEGQSPSKLWREIAALVVIVFGGFASAGSLVVVVLYLVSGQESEPGFLAKTAVKAAFFGVFALAASVYLMRSATLGTVRPPEDRRTTNIVPLIFLLALASAIAFPNLAMGPRAEPDEVHHLIVARNIAEYGVYGSGHPDTGFIEFDPYDSVGPPVLLPVAAALKVGGVSVAPARVVMGLFFCALALAAYGFAASAFGRAGGVVAGALVVIAPMSPYLSRTLYGEVPALLFFFAALWAWRTALSKAALPLAFLSGLFFGLSVLSKTYMMLAVFSVGAAMMFGWLRQRKIDWRNAAAIACGAIAVVGTWTVYKSLNEKPATEAGSETVAEYQHNLMFGFEPVVRTSAVWLDSASVVILLLAGLVYTAPRVFGRDYDPPMAALWLWTGFVAFWFTFFTTGNHPRYAWYTFASGMIFLAPALVAAIRHLKENRRPLAAMVAAVLLAGLFTRAGRDTVQLWRDEAMMEEYAVAAIAADAAAADQRVVTSFWPVTRIANFAGNTPIDIARDDDWDVLIACPTAQNTVSLPEGEPERRIGRYAVYRK